MNFLGIFRAQNDRLVVGYLMGAEIFEFRHRNILMLALFKPVAAVKKGQLSRHFGQFRHTIFQTPITLA